jgi:hypothetical protein
MTSNFQFDDDLDGVVLTPPAATAPATATKPAPQLDEVPASPSSVESLDWGTATAMPLGDGLDRIKPKVGETIRFAVIPGAAPKRAKTHFVALAGKAAHYYLCTGANCPACKTGDQAKTMVVALAIQYVNADATNGKLADISPVYKLGYLLLSTTAFNLVLEAPVEGSKPTDIDYAMGYDGRRYSFGMIDAKARHIQRNETAQVVALAKPFASRLANKLGSPMPVNAVFTVVPPVAEGMDK